MAPPRHLRNAPIQEAFVDIAVTLPPNVDANIIGWPDEPERQKIIAIELANTAALLMCPNGRT
jgi:hypothetical protein